MDIRKKLKEIIPEHTYSVSEAAHYLGIHRCTIYAYIKHPKKPLRFIGLPDSTHRLFKGTDLISYKNAGLPKRGRKDKDGKE